MDSNIVLTESGKILELQMTAETVPYSASKVQELLDVAGKGIQEIISKQYEVTHSY